MSERLYSIFLSLGTFVTSCIYIFLGDKANKFTINSIINQRIVLLHPETKEVNNLFNLFSKIINFIILGSTRTPS